LSRIIVRPRRASEAPAAEAAVRAFVGAESEAGGAKLVKSRASVRLHVLEMSVADAQRLATTRPDLIVEEDQPLELFKMPDLPAIAPAVAEDVWQVTVRDPAGQPIPNCTVFAVGDLLGFRAETDANGRTSIRVEAGLVDRVIISPRAGFWSRVVPPPQGARSIETTLMPLDAPRSSAWMLSLLGVNAHHAGLSGQGVTIAVVDSGIARVPGLSVRDGLNTLDGGDPAGWAADEKGHGTHCAGIAAARPDEAVRFRGIAPQAEIFSVKVFPGGFISDLVEAIDWCRERRVDLVNLSLGSRNWSEALAAAITEAVEAGVTLVAATGNDATAVAFPASHPLVLGVGAIGRMASFPRDSAHGGRIGPYRDWHGGLFSATFTNFGAEVDVCAPGVAIPSTVPQGYAAWDGTSMACPIVTALLALALEAVPALRTGTRAQVDALRWIATAGAIDMGMPREIQGHGLVTAPAILAAARSLVGSWSAPQFVRAGGRAWRA
jgi:subtilisin family serine protease